MILPSEDVFLFEHLGCKGLAPGGDDFLKIPVFVRFFFSISCHNAVLIVLTSEIA